MLGRLSWAHPDLRNGQLHFVSAVNSLSPSFLVGLLVLLGYFTVNLGEFDIVVELVHWNFDIFAGFAHWHGNF